MELQPTAGTGRATRGPRRQMLLSVALVLALAAGAVAFLQDPAEEPTQLVVGAVVGGAQPEPTLPATTTTTTPPLPVPEALPTNYFAATPEIVLGTIEIPRLDLVEELHVGMTLTAINRGPSHWPGTALPGQFGNTVIAGHRTTYSKPFRHLELLEEGDLVHFHLRDGTSWTYEVRGVIVVPEEALAIARQSPAHTATLFACHPPGSADERIVAKLRLLDDAGQPVDTEEDLPPLDEGLHPDDQELLVRDPAGPAEITDPFAEVASS